MNRKSKQRIIVINLLLFALLFGLVSLNKEFLRPLYSNTPIIKVLIGSFPNFIAAYIISLAFVNVVVIREPKYGRLIVYLSSLLVFVILTIEEFKPMWGASTHYDSFDIFASGLGSLLAILTFELVVLKRKTK
ncbi:unnamed protein product [marine sediment metagenome]|uniref:VanZ-like domain-containing protein n=1 Tax=marine sediment metagenome TaxID=412755 RepID=X1RX97_9ZZZZ